MVIEQKHTDAIREIVKGYQTIRNAMASPLNARPPGHLQFIAVCNNHATRIIEAMPADAVFADYALLHDVALGVVYHAETNDVIHGYTVADKEALVELLGCALGMLRRAQ
jgi:hypothetical protein